MTCADAEHALHNLACDEGTGSDQHQRLPFCCAVCGATAFTLGACPGISVHLYATLH